MESSLAMLFAVLELSLVTGAVMPNLDAFAALLVIYPLTLVGRSVCVDILPETVHSVGIPLAFVRGASRVSEVAVAMHLRTVETPFVLLLAIRSGEDALSMPVATHPLTFVLCAALDDALGALDEGFVAAPRKRGVVGYHEWGVAALREEDVAVLAKHTIAAHLAIRRHGSISESLEFGRITPDWDLLLHAAETPEGIAKETMLFPEDFVHDCLPLFRSM
mmetsp:Transcript_120629/g.341074  ORF Transcript_120629/g.341074 Transcript_120629/m.341074 type:complete len:220 (-) Transcript_120629:131-790(-)